MFAEPGGAGGPGALAPKDFLFGWRRRRLGRVRELRSGFDLLHAGLLWIGIRMQNLDLLQAYMPGGNTVCKRSLRYVDFRFVVCAENMWEHATEWDRQSREIRFSFCELRTH